MEIVLNLLHYFNDFCLYIKENLKFEIYTFLKLNETLFLFVKTNSFDFKKKKNPCAYIFLYLLHCFNDFC